MATTVSGTDGIDKVKDGTITAGDLAGGTGTGNLTQYTTSVTPLPASGSALTGSHTLGVVPVEAVLELTCLTAEAGYSVGDIVQSVLYGNNTTWYPLSVYKTTASVGVMQLSGGYVVGLQNKSTGGLSLPTAANWSYRFRLRAA